MNDIIDAKTLVTLQQLQIYALKQKSRILAGGEAIPEQDYPDEPQLEDFDNQTSDTAAADPDISGLDAIMPLPSAAPNQSIPAPVTDGTKTLAERIAERKAQSATLPIDDAIAAAAQAPQPQPAQTPQPQPTQASTPQEPRRQSRMSEYRDARKAWRIERWRRKFEDARLKKQALDLTAGYDDIIIYIDKIINDSRKRDASRIGDDININ